MSAATLTSKGQTTIPADIRKGLGLEPGDQIEFHLLSNGSATMRVKRGTLKDFIGVLHQPKQQALSIKAMDDGIARTMRAKHARKQK
jgi:AbrB family looped-hinge helix DNA binding protein